MATVVVLVSGLAVAVVSDLRTHRIPNWLTGAIAAAGFGMAFGGGALTPAQAALGLTAGLLLMMPGHLIGATGAGDVKLMAGIGALVGPSLVLRAFLFTAVAGGILAVGVAMHRRRLSATLSDAGRLVTSPLETRAAICAPERANRFAYGPAIAAGTMLALLMR